MTSQARHVVVIGDADVTRRACALLNQRSVATTHLHDPSDGELRTALAGAVDGVAVLVHDDMRALRYGLVIAHARPGIRLFVTMFDETARAQLERAVPNGVVLSPAAIAAPSMVAAAIAPDHVAVRRHTGEPGVGWLTVDASTESERASLHPYQPPRRLRIRGLVGRLRGQLRPYDAGSAVLLGGVLGLLAVILVDTLVGLRHDSLTRALYDATRTTATISAPELDEEPWVLVWATIAALLVMGFTAAFAAGIVHHLISGRHVALLGRRVMPRSGHVVVTGMGQVGVRLATELRMLGVAVLGVERHESAAALPTARELGIPVLVGDATSPRVLRRANLTRAVAVVATGSEERDNIAIAVAAQAVNPRARVVIRAGADDAIDETRSLLHIGSVVDVNGLTAAYVVESMAQQAPFCVLADHDRVLAIDAGGTVVALLPESTTRCSCGQPSLTGV